MGEFKGKVGIYVYIIQRDQTFNTQMIHGSMCFSMTVMVDRPGVLLLPDNRRAKLSPYHGVPGQHDGAHSGVGGM